MLEFLTGAGLAVASGLNAYIPMIALGLAGRFLDFVTLPAGWAWLENEWVLGILAVLLVVEVVADKVPLVDSVNDWLQVVVRPAAGGIVFGTGAGSETAAVTDPAAIFTNDAWIPVAIGVVLALATSLTKSAIRPVLNTLTLGIAAPIVSTVEDVVSVLLTVLAIVLPVLVIVVICALVVAAVVIFRRAAHRRRDRAKPAGVT